MVHFMDQKLTLKFMMHSKELINVALFNQISSFLLDSIFNTRLNKLSIMKKNMKIKSLVIKFLKQMSLMQKSLSGKSMHSNPDLQDLLLFIERFSVQSRDLWLFLSNIWVESGLSFYHLVKQLFVQYLKSLQIIAKVFTFIYTSKVIKQNLICRI